MRNRQIHQIVRHWSSPKTKTCHRTRKFDCGQLRTWGLNFYSWRWHEVRSQQSLGNGRWLRQIDKKGQRFQGLWPTSPRAHKERRESLSKRLIFCSLQWNRSDLQRRVQHNRYCGHHHSRYSKHRGDSEWQFAPKLFERRLHNQNEDTRRQQLSIVAAWLFVQTLLNRFSLKRTSLTN